MPKTSTAFPLLTKFYGCAIIILVLAMCCTCLVYGLYFMNSSGLELHQASFFLRLKVRATRKNPFCSLEAQQVVLVTYSPGDAVFLEATKVNNWSNKKSHFKLTLVHTCTRIRSVMWSLFIVPDVNRTPPRGTPWKGCLVRVKVALTIRQHHSYSSWPAKSQHSQNNRLCQDWKTIQGLRFVPFMCIGRIGWK